MKFVVGINDPPFGEFDPSLDITMQGEKFPPISGGLHSQCIRIAPVLAFESGWPRYEIGGKNLITFAVGNSLDALCVSPVAKLTLTYHQGVI